MYCFIVNNSLCPTTFWSFISSFIVCSSIKHPAWEKVVVKFYLGLIEKEKVRQ